MEVVAAAGADGGGGGGGSAPFARRDVREWSRLDSATGAREHARVESDRWTARSANSARSYGKVVDSRVCNAADGRAQATSRRQLEVFRQQGPGGSFQVVRTSSSTVSSSSSSTATATAAAASARLQLGFDNLQLSLNPLDVGPQRTRASVGRSGSIGSRRPPSRQPRASANANATASASPSATDGPATTTSAAAAATDPDAQVDSLTAQVSRICRQLHVEAHRAAFGPSASRLLAAAANAASDADEESDAGVVIQEVSDSDSGAAASHEDDRPPPPPAPASAPAPAHPPAARRRSSSIEDLQQQEGGARADDQPAAWTRASQVRRSLQFPTRNSQERESPPTQRPLPGRLFPEDSKLFEGGKLKGLEALESVFRRGANIAESVNKSMTHDHEHSDASNADSLANHLRNESINRSSQSFNMDGFMRRTTTNGTNSSNASKRHSFVTVESLKEVRGRLRPLNSPSDEEPKLQKSILKPSKDEDDQDDGIVTDDHVKHPDSDPISDVPTSKVKSYILGMEVLANNNRNGTRKPILGTGSLESRTSNRSSSSSNNRSEEWYNRRKSYGFEQVHTQDATETSRPTRLWEKNRVESSTDSGICRSSEAVSGPPWNRTSPSKIEEGKAFDCRKPDIMKISHSIQIKKQEDKDKLSENGEMKDDDSPYQRGRRTIVTLGNEYNKNNSNYKSSGDDGIIVHNSIIKDTSSVSLNGYRTSSEDDHRFKPLAGPGSTRDVRRQSEPLTITIPIVSEDGERETSNVESKRLFFRQLSEGTSLSIESADRKSAFTNGSALKDSFKRGTWNGGDDWANVSKAMDNEMKRHSIAVDESKYVREGIKRFSNLHDTKTKELANVSTSELVKRFAAMHAGKKEEPVFSNKDKFSQNPMPSGINVSFVQNGESFISDDQSKRQKKVEFCKTEVHFAAESGRVNIVETDEKPPPSNPIRRRRRSIAGSLPQAPPDASKSILPEIRFGDSPYEKKLLGGNEVEAADPAPLPAPVIVKPEPTRPTVLSLTKFQNDVEKEDHTFTQANATISPPLHQESTLSAYSETVAEHISVTTQPNEPMPRSILKNNRRPRPFILGDNSDSPIETNDGQEEKWGVRLRPVQPSSDAQGASMWRSTVTLRSTAFDSVQPSPERKDEPLPASIHGNGESELQKMLKALRPAGQRRSNSETDSTASPQCSPVAVKKNLVEPANNSVQVTISSPPTDSVFTGWSVADRIKHVEDMKQTSMETKGYSTRINFGSGEATVIESGSSDDQQNASLKHSVGSSLFQKSDKSKPMWLRREEKKQELQGPEPCAEEATIHQVSVASAMLPSYDPNRIRRVETLVSTRSGQPKITSIALRYEGDHADDRSHKQSAFSSSSTYTQQHSAWKNLDTSSSYPPRSEEKPTVGFTYYKPSDASRTQPLEERRDRTYKVDKHKERLHIEEKTTREKVSPNREQLFTSSERRSISPKDSHLRSASPHQNRPRPTSYPSAQKPSSSSPCPRYDSDRERSLSPASKHQPKATTYFGEVSARSSAFSAARRHESPRKAEGARGSYERKGEERSGHQRPAAEPLVNGQRSARLETSTRDERRRSSYESGGGARSRSASRGRSLSPSKALDGRKQQPQPQAPPAQQAPPPHAADAQGGYDSPIYENIDDVLEESAGARRAETDSAILEELTRAADQILQAVNGYTDEDSRASSDDDDGGGRRYRRGRRGGRPTERLCTIAEAGPAARRPSGRSGATTSGAGVSSSSGGAGAGQGQATRRAQRLSQTRLANNSSTSSIESFTREVRRSAAAAGAHAQARALLRRERQAIEETRRKVTSAAATSATASAGAGSTSGSGAPSSGKPSSRTARLLQRASSRELLLKAHASSSEDVMSGAEAADAAATAAAALAARKARGPRRQRASANASASANGALSASAAAAAAAKSNSLTSASSGGRRPSPAAQLPAAASVAASAAAATAAGRPRRREADVPRGKDRSHGTRSEDIRRRGASRREDADAVRTRSSRPSGHGGIGGGGAGGGAGRERGAASERRPTAAAAAAGRAAPGAASHAVAKKPSSSRSESLSHSKVSK